MDTNERFGFPSHATVAQIKQQYPAGTRVRLIKMDDKQAPPVGTLGTVICVDDAGSLCMQWDNGSSLSLLWGEDIFEKVSE